MVRARLTTLRLALVCVGMGAVLLTVGILAVNKETHPWTDVTAELDAFAREAPRSCALPSWCECAAFAGPIMPCHAAGLAAVRCFLSSYTGCGSGRLRLCHNVVGHCTTPVVTVRFPADVPARNQTRAVYRGAECPPDVGTLRSSCEVRQFGELSGAVSMCTRDGESRPRLEPCPTRNPSVVGIVIMTSGAVLLVAALGLAVACVTQSRLKRRSRGRYADGADRSMNIIYCCYMCAAAALP